MAYTFFVDFGSTYTKLCVVDLNNGELVMTTSSPTTIATGVDKGLFATFDKAKQYIGEKGVKTSNVVACSSIAGGLRMVVVGLTERFSLLAGKNVALSAGAKILKTYGNYLTDSDVKEIENINPEILLLCGGIEGGNASRVMANATKLKSANITSYVVYAGNNEIAKHVRHEIELGGLKCFVAENVFPEYGKLNPKSANEIIRDLFMERIAWVKGLTSVMEIIGNDVMPTPAAVLTGGELFATHLNNMMIFDVGGATTDVYSYVDNLQQDVRHVGVPEPFSKRTVEGDLGVASPEALTVAEAVEISARRHCGRIINAYAKNSKQTISGKDLTKIETIIGTGGAIINSQSPINILSKATRKQNEKEILLPNEVEFYLDKKYILYALGLGAKINADSILNIAKENIVKV